MFECMYRYCRWFHDLKGRGNVNTSCQHLSDLSKLSLDNFQRCGYQTLYR